jgi:hypothetical protein
MSVCQGWGSNSGASLPCQRGRFCGLRNDHPTAGLAGEQADTSLDMEEEHHVSAICRRLIAFIVASSHGGHFGLRAEISGRTYGEKAGPSPLKEERQVSAICRKLSALVSGTAGRLSLLVQLKKTGGRIHA